MKEQGSVKQSDETAQGQWRATVDLLRTTQNDYQQARKQLESICSMFDDRENAASRQLQFALESATETERHYSQNEAMCLRAYCLGNFKVYVDYRQVEHWHSFKSKAILKYLIARHRQPVPKDVLMEVFWEDCSPELANCNLKAAIHSLRRTLGSLSDVGNSLLYVLYIDGAYLINSKITLLIDDEEFERHWFVGHDLEKKSKSDDAIREYTMAEALYKGDYLADDIYEDWTWLRREALKDIYLTILNKLVEHSIRKKNYQDCVTYCQKILAKDNCREDAYRHLMFCYSCLGQRSRAISWYHLAEKTLKKELNISPEKRTKAIYQKILSGEE